MVIGIGMGTPLGVAAGLFHMLNNALYKSGLFLSAGNVENKTGQSDFAGLGGLSKAMPITFFAALIFAFSISGIPPFNGFASKWMIYQGIIDFGNGTGIANQLWIVWLALAVLGSALTLASFIKFISGIFLGRKKEKLAKVKEVNVLMWFPILLLALTCIGFGIFAGNYVVPEFFKGYTGEFQFVGVWQSTTVGILIILSIILGLLIYLIGNIKNFRTTDSFIGGETFREQTDFSVTEFYNTIKEIKPLTGIYKRAEKKWFDIYDLSKSLVLWLNKILSKIHTGVLTSYAMWIFAGIIIMMLYFL
jgi:NADH:ubiquinone oxidoreductase subunit 5 (subunit L)/multisubunit Na+/H+ antiporter MnhA subunit